MYKVTGKDLKGQIEGFPIEVVQKMVQRCCEENEVNIITKLQRAISGGFRWKNSTEGYDFWNEVICNKNFKLFFEKYPKKESKEFKEVDTHVYYRGVSNRGEEIVSELEKLGGISYYDISAEKTDYYYVVDPIDKRIDFVEQNTLYSHILEECYTEKFLPEVKPEVKSETIEIDGKKYNKQDILDRVKELKEVE